jgi:NTP pyrophosphatase (non-canonical NTP hydrolase)
MNKPFDASASIAIMDQVSFRLQLSPDDKERYLWLALAGEAGEALNLVKKQWRDGFTPDRLEKLKMELTDVYIYLRVLEAFYGMSLDQWAKVKMQEVETRPFAQPEHTSKVLVNCPRCDKDVVPIQDKGDDLCPHCKLVLI